MPLGNEKTAGSSRWALIFTKLKFASLDIWPCLPGENGKQTVWFWSKRGKRTLAISCPYPFHSLQIPSSVLHKSTWNDKWWFPPAICGPVWKQRTRGLSTTQVRCHGARYGLERLRPGREQQESKKRWSIPDNEVFSYGKETGIRLLPSRTADSLHSVCQTGLPTQIPTQTAKEDTAVHGMQQLSTHDPHRACNPEIVWIHQVLRHSARKLTSKKTNPQHFTMLCGTQNFDCF